jgi:hypothetical protein
MNSISFNPYVTDRPGAPDDESEMPVAMVSVDGGEIVSITTA